jgi:hypothetical protein
MAKENKKLQQVQHNKKVLLEALEKTLGVVTSACRKVNLDRTTFYNYVNSDKEFAAAVDSIQDVSLDFAESKLFELIDGVWAEGKEKDDGEATTYKQPPNVTATIFYLKTKGKKRGYIERTEISGKDGEPIETMVRVIKPKAVSKDDGTDSDV